MCNISSVGEKCLACSACKNVCPNSAVEFAEDEDGFRYPKINSNCTNCGACASVCQIITSEFNSESPKSYAFYASDDIRLNSASGGVFPILANYFINNNGYVCGAIWDENGGVSHIISSKKEDIIKMQGSKYIQSDMKYCFNEILRMLNEGKKILFTGTPCQVSGLKKFLNKDYNNLYCIDLICHGVASDAVYKKYINENLGSGMKWLNTNFRDKISGWSSFSVKIEALNKQKQLKKFTNLARDDVFMKSYINNLSIRKSCVNCKFHTITREGDITIGDFWGVWEYDASLNDEKGISIILDNNEKGHYLVDVLKQNAKMIKEIPMDNAVKGNPCLVHSCSENKDRKLFFKLLNKKTLRENFDVCFNDKADYIIVNFWDSYYNYGALLTAYALQELINDFGFTTKLLDVGYRTSEGWYKNSFMENFVLRFLHTTKPLNYIESNKISKTAKGVILGSDQILRPRFINYNLNKYLLNWVDRGTRKIALSASFGINKEEYENEIKNNPMHLKYTKNALQSFDYLSCRESSGKEIYRDIYELNSDCISDPVFLIPKDKYDGIIKYSKIDNSDKIVSYVLDENDEWNSVYKKLSEKLNADTVKLNNKKYLVEDWLKSIKECKFLITNSFHGVCFALIFNKPFACIKNEERGNARFDSLIQNYNIGNAFFNSIDEFLKSDFNCGIDYSLFNEKLKQKINSDLNVIEKVLKENYSNNDADLNKIKNINYLNGIQKKYSMQRLFAGLNYYRCRILANLTVGKRKHHYISKKNNIKYVLKQQKPDWNNYVNI